MAIRLTYIRKNGKLIKDFENLELIKQIEKFLNKKKIEAKFTISRYYGDRWYEPKIYVEALEQDMR